MNQNILASWQFLALMAAVSAAVGAIFAKIGVEDAPSDLVTFLRTMVILVALSIFLLSTRQLSFPRGVLTGRNLLFISLSGIGGAASWIFYFRALKVGEVAQVAPIDKLSIVLIAVMGVLILKERLSTVNWVGIGMAVLGAILVGFR
jgi:transporter family protein